MPLPRGLWCSKCGKGFREVELILPVEPKGNGTYEVRLTPECPNCFEAAYWRTDPFPKRFQISDWDMDNVIRKLRIKVDW